MLEIKIRCSVGNGSRSAVVGKRDAEGIMKLGEGCVATWFGQGNRALW